MPAEPVALVPAAPAEPETPALDPLFMSVLVAAPEAFGVVVVAAAPDWSFALPVAFGVVVVAAAPD